MSTSNGQNADETTFNNAYMSRTADTSTTGKVDLNDSGSAAIVDAQAKINANITGVAANASDIADNVTDIASNDTDIATLQTGKINDAGTPTDNAVPRFDGATGIDLQNSDVIIDDSNNVTGINDITIEGISSLFTTKIADGSEGSSGDVWTSTDANGNGNWATPAAGGTVTEPGLLENLGIEASVAGSALTIRLKQANGSTDPAGGSGAVRASFRDTTPANGGYVIRSRTSALSVVVPSGATLGHMNAVEGFIYVYLVDNAGTLSLAVSSIQIDEGTEQAVTAITAASDDSVLYGTALAALPIRLIARMRSTQASVGTWAAVPTEISPVTPSLILTPAQFLAQTSTGFNLSTGGYATDEWANQVDNSNRVHLPPGSWTLYGFFSFRKGTATGTTFIGSQWATTNGSNTTTPPTAISADAGNVAWFYGEVDDIPDQDLPIPIVRITVTTTTTVYLVGLTRFTTPGTGSFTVKLYAERIKP